MQRLYIYIYIYINAIYIYCISQAVSPESRAVMEKRLREAGVEVVTTAQMTAAGFDARRRKKRTSDFLVAVRRLAARRALAQGPNETHHAPH